MNALTSILQDKEARRALTIGVACLCVVFTVLFLLLHDFYTWKESLSYMQTSPQIEEVEARLEQAEYDRNDYTAGSLAWVTLAGTAEKQKYFSEVCEDRFGLHPNSELFAQCVRKEEDLLQLRANLYQIQTEKARLYQIQTE